MQTLGFLKPKSDATISAIQEGLKDKEGSVRLAAAWALEQLGLKGEPAIPTTPVIDLVKSVDRAGFQAEFAAALPDFVRFGSTKLAKQGASKHPLDRVEAYDKAEGHRRKIAAQVWRLDNRPIAAPDDVNVKYALNGQVLVECPVPLRLEVFQKEDGDHFSADLVHLNASWAASCQWLVDKGKLMPMLGPMPWFLGKDDKLHECLSHQEAAAVKRADGILYLPESTGTTLVFVLAPDRKTAKTIVHHPETFRVDLVFDGVEHSQILDWGYYRLDKLIDAHWDSHALIEWNATGAFGAVKAPHYFRPEGSKKPFVVKATLLAATLIDKDGKKIASYQRAHDYGELVRLQAEDSVLEVARKKAPKRAPKKNN